MYSTKSLPVDIFLFSFSAALMMRSSALRISTPFQKLAIFMVSVLNAFSTLLIKGTGCIIDKILDGYTISLIATSHLS